MDFDGAPVRIPRESIRWPFQFSTLLSGVFAVSGAVSPVKLRSESVGTGQAHSHTLFQREQHRLCSAVLARRLARFLFLVRKLLCTALRPSNQRKCLVHYSGVSVLTFHPKVNLLGAMEQGTDIKYLIHCSTVRLDHFSFSFAATQLRLAHGLWEDRIGTHGREWNRTIFLLAFYGSHTDNNQYMEIRVVGSHRPTTFQWQLLTVLNRHSLNVLLPSHPEDSQG